MIDKYLWIIGWLLLITPLFGQSIAEKKAHLQTTESGLDQEMDLLLLQVNHETQEIHAEIKRLYNEVWALYQQEAPPEDYKCLLDQINEKKHYLNHLENHWRDLATRSNRAEGYGLWHAPDTILEQLIIDYGSQDYVYLIPPEVGSIKLSIDSNLPIPRTAWGEMLELILNQNGVGIQTLNPYLRQLYLIKENHSNLRLITNISEDVEMLSPDARICFVLSPEPSEVRRTYAFLEKFINPNTTVIQVLGRDILIIGRVGDIRDLLNLYEFIATNRGEKEYRLLPVYKMGADEMAKIVEAIFDQSEPYIEVGEEGPHTTRQHVESNGLKMIVLENAAQALFVIGTQEEVCKAEEIVSNVESQIGGARDKTVFWYTVKHSDAEELADILYRIYLLMIETGTGSEGTNNSESGADQNKIAQANQSSDASQPIPPPVPQKEPPPSLYDQEGFYQEGGYIVNPAPAQPRIFTPTEANNNRDNFIVDIKTGAIVMVVEADLLPKIKDLLRKLDVPKKMVQIETLLFEKMLKRENSFGLNLLKIGEAASRCNAIGAVFNNIFPKGDGNSSSESIFTPFGWGGEGVSHFFFSRRGSQSGIPAFDLAYRFLLNQEDIQINSNPSLLTINQTPATIAINEDISVNTGVFQVETAKGVTLKDAFTRAQYGITISIKPTIHLTRDDDGQDFDYVTLETDITFDTIHGGGDRPNVTRRHLTNQVQVPDGDTVVLGGLRRKVSNDHRDSIPFLGELPGLGKLFGINTLRDNNTEMFIFITPHIVKDPKEQLTCLRQELLCLRPGDVPYFLECVEEAHRYEKTRLMEGSLTALLGRPRERYYIPDNCCAEDLPGEYDGR